MFVSPNRTYLVETHSINSTEAQGMHSAPSAAGVLLNPQAKHRSPTPQPIHVSPFPIGGREVGAYEYDEAKQAAFYSAQAIHDPNLLQADVETIKAAAIFSALHLPNDFPGPEELGWGPLECSVAAGPSHLIAATTSSWSVLNKAGETLFQCDLSDWFAGLNTDDEEVMVFNPKVLYDQNTGRWILIACAWSESFIFDGLRSYFLISVSQTRNPLGNWWGWKLSANLNGQQFTPYHAASLGLGLDHTSLYLTANMFDGAGKFMYAKMRILDKAPFLRGGEISWYDFWDMRNADDTPAFGLRPAHTFGMPGVEYFVNAKREGGELTLWGLRNPLNAEPQLQRRSLATEGYSLAPNARQAGFHYEIDTGDTRIVNCVFRNGVLWAAHTVAVNWGEDENRAAIQWFMINPGTGKIVQQNLFGAPGYDYYCPTLMLDGQANMVMVFNRSGVDEFPTIRFTGRLAIDTPNKLHASSLLKQGGASGVSAWGAYNGAAIDPNDIKIWIIGKYPATESIGATWIGETSFMSSHAESNQKK